MSNITVYQKPTCTTCRKLHALLLNKGIDFQEVNYFFDPLSKEKIEDLLFKLKMTPQELMRKKEPLYRDLGIDKKNYTNEYLVDVLVNHPELIERPIVERGAKAVVARPVEKVLDLLPRRG